jgi:hypothetical protein
MSDYLESLIAKSLGLVDTIQPRVPSLFEPLQPSIDANFAAISHPDTKTTITDELQNSEANVPDLSPEPSLGNHFEPEFAPAKASAVSESILETKRTIDSDMISTSPSPIKRPLPEPITLSEDLLQSIPSSNDLGEPKSASIHLTENSAKSARLKGSEPDISVLVGQITHKFNSKRRESEQIHQRGQDHKPVSQNAPQDPRIYVKIGRIEVRAVNSEQPMHRPKSAASPPLLTLEEYQRQRKGGLR